MEKNLRLAFEEKKWTFFDLALEVPASHIVREWLPQNSALHQTEASANSARAIATSTEKTIAVMKAVSLVDLILLELFT